MGAQQTPDNEPNQDGATFILDSQKIHVVILSPIQLTQRNAILDAVLNLSTLRELYHMVYLAAPRLLGTTIDAKLFRSRGIGLLFFDERRIDEAVTAQPLQQSEPMRANAQPQDNTLATELATLRSMYVEMEQSLDQLRNDLRTIRDAPQTSHELSQLPRRTEDPIPHAAFQHLPQSAGLPSYFANNPWLEVLSKRGIGERATIAG